MMQEPYSFKEELPDQQSLKLPRLRLAARTTPAPEQWQAWQQPQAVMPLTPNLASPIAPTFAVRTMPPQYRLSRFTQVGQCLAILVLTLSGASCLWLASEEPTWGMRLFALLLLVLCCATYSVTLVHRAIAPRVRMFALSLLLLSLLACLGFLAQSIYFMSHDNSEHVTVQQNGQLAVVGSVTDRISQVWQVESAGQVVYYAKLKGTQYTTTYRIADAQVGVQLHVGQTVQISYQDGRGDIVAVTHVTILGNSGP